MFFGFFMFHARALLRGELTFTPNHEPAMRHCQVSYEAQQFARISQKNSNKKNSCQIRNQSFPGLPGPGEKSAVTLLPIYWPAFGSQCVSLQRFTCW